MNDKAKQSDLERFEQAILERLAELVAGDDYEELAAARYVLGGGHV